VGAVWRVGKGRPAHTSFLGEHTVAVAQAAAQDRLDVGLGGGAVGIVGLE